MRERKPHLYAGLSADERRAGRRDRLLDAAFELFGSRGYGATTIEQICTTSGVTARHFYEEFATREALLCAIYDRTGDEMLVAVRAAIYAPGAGAREIVRGGARAFFEFVTSDPRRGRLLFLEVVGVSAQLEEHRRAVLHECAAETARSTRRLDDAGLGRLVDYDLLSVALNGAAQELAIQWMVARPKPDLETLIDLLALLWMRALQLDGVATSVAS